LVPVLLLWFSLLVVPALSYGDPASKFGSVQAMINQSFAGGEGSLAGIPPVVRDEIDRLESNDAGRRATGAASLGEMGAAAVPAIPWLLAAVDDVRSVNSLRYGHVSVAFIAGRALSAIGRPAVEYVRKKLEDPTATRDERVVAIRAVAIMKAPELLDPLLKQIKIACSPEGNCDLDFAFTDALVCFLPDRRVPDALLRVGAEQERRNQARTAIIWFNGTTEPARLAGTATEFKTITAAKEWWGVNGSTAELKVLSNDSCPQ
jgi:hypothetical protein